MEKLWIPMVICLSVIVFFAGLYFYVPQKFEGVPQKAVRNMIQEFHSDDHIFADARRKCREEIRRIEPAAKFGNVVDKRYKNSVISRMDWESDASHRSYCRVIDGQVTQVTIDSAIAYGCE